MIKKRKKGGLEKIQGRYAYIFTGHYIFGMIVFFALPVISSIWYAFNTVTIESHGIATEFVGLENFNKIINVDPKYLNNLRDSLVQTFYSLPVIISVSLILAILLNQKFKGRIFARALFFLPVIIMSSYIVVHLTDFRINAPMFSTNSNSAGLMNYELIVAKLNIPVQFRSILTYILSHTLSLIWKSGVQIILFLSGLQSIPESLYEVSKIEGANKWEEFWMITVPSLRHVISLVIIYTMIDLFTSSDNAVTFTAFGKMKNQVYGESSAMLWFYFIIVLAVMGIVIGLYNRWCIKRWE